MNLDGSLPANELDKPEMVAIRSFEFEMPPTRRPGHDNQFLKERNDVPPINVVAFNGRFEKSRKNARLGKKPHAKTSANQMPHPDVGDRECQGGDFAKK
jgi:hypothetical protein